MKPHTLYQLQKFAIYSFGFLSLPVVLGLVLAFSSLSKLMLLQNTPTYEASALAAVAPPYSPAVRTGQKTATFLLSASGTQSLEFLTAYEIIASTRAFQITFAVPNSTGQKLIPLTGGIALLPAPAVDLTRAEGDLLVVPSIVDPDDDRLLNFLKDRSGHFKRVLILGEAARLAVRANLLGPGAWTTHFMAKNDVEKLAKPGAIFSTDRVVQNGSMITSSGLYATWDATFTALREIPSLRSALSESTQSLDYRPPLEGGTTPQDSIGFFGWAQIFFRSAYDWQKTDVGVLVADGVSEAGLATVLDALPRTFSIRPHPVTLKREIVRTKHGLLLGSIDTIAGSVPMQIAVLPPSARDQAQNEDVKNWIRERQLSVKDFTRLPSGSTLSEVFGLIFQLNGESSTLAVASMIQASPPKFRAGTSPRPGSTGFWLFLEPLALGLAGLLAASAFVRKFLPKAP